MKHINWLLVSIVFLGFILRIVGLDQIPAGFTPDEASQAYTAYSLLKTGSDEWGIAWPVTAFRSFADYKAPLQTYLMIPSIAIFGLNEFAARLPSAIFGTLAIVVIYFFGKKINPKTGLLTAFLLVISPWHIQFSRTALEVNLSSFLFPAGLLFFIKGLKKPSFFSLTAIFWGLSLYSYHAAKIFIPLFLIFLIFVYLKQIRRITRLNVLTFGRSVIIFLIFALPTYYSMFFGSSGARGNDLALTNLNTLQVAEIADSQYLSPLKNISPVLPRILNNKATFILDKFSENLVSYYSPTFWFTEGGQEITYSVIPGRGLLYLWQLPFVILGLIYLLKQKPKHYKLLLIWLLLAAIPAALTQQGYRPNRAGSFLGFWEIITAFGIFYLFTILPHYKKIISAGLSLIVLVSFTFYLNDYVFASAIKYPNSLSYGYRDLVAKISPIEDNYQNIIVERGTQSQSFIAFYSKTDPKIFQQESAIWWDRFSQTDFTYLDMLDDYHLGKYQFKSINLRSDLIPGTLVVISADKVPESFYPYIIDTVYYPNAKPAFYLLSTNETLP